MTDEKQAARLIVDDDFTVADVDPRVFGTLVEHLGRCVYGGIYDPESEYADEDGFRTDVLDLVRELGVTTVRYPGGNFVSGYRWEDGVGPRDQRPRRLDLAWHSTETNAVGLHEMENWLHKAGEKNAEGQGIGRPLEMMEAVNLGTRGLEDALNLVEYANIPGGTERSEQRRANGADEPFGIKLWCLGNEMDGPWQLGHSSAEEYASKVQQVAAGMRQIDPSVELVVCGSSGHGMPQFSRWEGTVLDRAYNNVDFVSCHAYYHMVNDDLASFLASGVDMDGFIADVSASIDAAKARAKSNHQVNISFDEWNVWYQDSEPSKVPSGIGNWPVAPHLLEDVYSTADAVVVGDLLITLLKHADRVRAASLAQLVNVIAPIMVPAQGKAYRQTSFFPFAQTAQAAQGATVLRPRLSTSHVSTDKYGEVDALDTVALRCADGSLAVLAVNRNTEKPLDLTVSVPGDVQSASALTLHEDDWSLANTDEQPERVGLKENSSVRVEVGEKSSEVSVSLPAVSWTILRVR